MPTPHTLGYRADIDGLRAISVLAVMAYHCGLGVQGGYIGVDVFFVISGFLITNQIHNELITGNFSLRNFWQRRIRRIWPAVTVMTFLILAVGFVVMFPVAYRQLAKDAVAQVCLISNYQFLYTID